LSQARIFAGPWGGEIESPQRVVFHESLQRLGGIWLARVKVRAGLIVLSGETRRSSWSLRSRRGLWKTNSAVAISDVPFRSLKVKADEDSFSRYVPVACNTRRIAALARRHFGKAFLAFATGSTRASHSNGEGATIKESRLNLQQCNKMF
jgi:hypothetical protein